MDELSSEDGEYASYVGYSYFPTTPGSEASTNPTSPGQHPQEMNTALVECLRTFTQLINSLEMIAPEDARYICQTIRSALHTFNQLPQDVLDGLGSALMSMRVEPGARPLPDLDSETSSEDFVHDGSRGQRRNSVSSVAGSASRESIGGDVDEVSAEDQVVESVEDMNEQIRQAREIHHWTAWDCRRYLRVHGSDVQALLDEEYEEDRWELMRYYLATRCS